MAENNITQGHGRKLVSFVITLVIFFSFGMVTAFAVFMAWTINGVGL